jgi:hypothetical protein
MKQPLCHMTCNQTYGSLQNISGQVPKDPNPSLVTPVDVDLDFLFRMRTSEIEGNPEGLWRLCTSESMGP